MPFIGGCPKSVISSQADRHACIVSRNLKIFNYQCISITIQSAGTALDVSQVTSGHFLGNLIFQALQNMLIQEISKHFCNVKLTECSLLEHLTSETSYSSTRRTN